VWWPWFHLFQVAPHGPLLPWVTTQAYLSIHKVQLYYQHKMKHLQDSKSGRMDKCRWNTRPRLERARSKGDEVSDPRQRWDTALVFRRTISNLANASETSLLLSSVRTDYWMVLPLKLPQRIRGEGEWCQSVQEDLMVLPARNKFMVCLVYIHPPMALQPLLGPGLSPKMPPRVYMLYNIHQQQW